MTTVLAYAAGILLNTPPWVYGPLALLVWLGSLSLKPHQVALRRTAVVPAIFILRGLSGLIGRPFGAATVAGLWLTGGGGTEKQALFRQSDGADDDIL